MQLYRIPKHFAALLISLSLGTINATAAQPPAFSAGSLVGWDAKTFSGRPPTQYQIVMEGSTSVLHAICRNSASGLVWKHRIDLIKTPILTWRWKISRIFPGLDPHAKVGDDYPARVYVVTGDPLFPWTLRSLVYVWANGAVGATAHGPMVRRSTPALIQTRLKSSPCVKAPPASAAGFPNGGTYAPISPEHLAGIATSSTRSR